MPKKVIAQIFFSREKKGKKKKKSKKKKKKSAEMYYFYIVKNWEILNKVINNEFIFMKHGK